jgi:hypothetical protein
MLGIAEAMILRALDGDIQAIKEIADRVEGRVSEPRHERLPVADIPNKREPTILKVVWEDQKSKTNPILLIMLRIRGL